METNIKTADFDYELPESYIAQHPSQKRDHSKLLIVDKKTDEIEDKMFYNIKDYLKPGDLLVFNNTRVIPARLFGKKEKTGGKVEVLLLQHLRYDTWECLVKPGKKAKPGMVLDFGKSLKGEVLSIGEGGTRIIEFSYDGVFENLLDELGQMPLPPYIHEKLEDKERYQTVYSKVNGSAAAPTAGLHFTDELIKELEEKGVETAYLTLHVGVGTFRPVKAENIKDHHMHTESFSIPEETAEKINKAKKEGRRVIAVGTTSLRALESAVNENGEIEAGKKDTDIFIYPGIPIRSADALITNFHLPKSTLLMLVSAFYDKDKILKAYQHAIDNNYRFFSFGDAMFIK